MTPFELEQRRAARQMKCYQAGQLVRRLTNQADPRPGTTDERCEHVRQAALGAIAEARGMMELLKRKGIATEAEVQDALDFGYDNLLAQLSAGKARQVLEAGHG